MDADKKEILVREIERWRSSKLLPEHYCDFLLNLYLEDPASRPKKVMGVTTNTIEASSVKWWLGGIAALVLAIYGALHFAGFPLSIQIGITFAVVGLLYAIGAVDKGRNHIRSLVFTGFASVLLLVLGLVVLYLQGMLGDAQPVIEYLLFCGVIWLIAGIFLGYGIFQICGWIVLTFVYSWMLNRQIGSMEWASAQFCWVPLALLFGWIGWLVQHRNKTTGGVFLLTAGILWLMPEIYTLVLSSEANAGMQASLFVKIAALGIFLFITRKKWIEWVV